MAIPCRCNKRKCQARRNLPKRPEHYVKHPRCHIPGCNGKMYVDEYRLRKGPKDCSPICYEGCIPQSFRDGRNFIHHYADKRCRHNLEWIKQQQELPRSPHHPKGSATQEEMAAQQEWDREAEWVLNSDEALNRRT